MGGRWHLRYTIVASSPPYLSQTRLDSSCNSLMLDSATSTGFKAVCSSAGKPFVVECVLTFASSCRVSVNMCRIVLAQRFPYAGTTWNQNGPQWNY